MKLSEIAFLEFDYKKSEQMVDSILQRIGDTRAAFGSGANQSDPQNQAEFFAYILKSYFLSLRGE